MTNVGELSNRFFDAIRRGDARTAAEGEPAASGFGHLAGHSYCLVVTYKRSGEAVATPVWFGVDSDGRLYFHTFEISAKLRRLRNNPRVLVAPCTMRGKPLGPSAAGTARILDDRHDAHAEATIQSNYGLLRRAFDSAPGSPEGRYVEVVPQ